MKSVLMVAFHYPPCFGSSGILRTLKFSQYLPAEGWRPLILTAHPRAYESTDPHQLSEIPTEALVHRAFAFDTGRHLAIAGSSLRLMALPDRWVSWCAGAVPAGLRLIRRHRPQAIWSTYPIATAHLIALTLHRLTSVPWVADFRDSMTEDNYPPNPSVRRVYRWIEQRAMAESTFAVFTARSSRQMYLDRYPDLAPDRCRLIPNGYAEEDFADLGPAASRSDRPPGLVRLLHSGLIYAEERDPRPLLRALARLKTSGAIAPGRLRIDLRAAGPEGVHENLLRELGLADIVFLRPALPYADALHDAASADGLLLLQGPSCNHQIPAKTYEYLRLQKPILALTSREGDTAALLDETGGATVVDLMSEHAIHDALPGFLASLREGTHPVPNPIQTQRYARRPQARELALLFAAAAARPVTAGASSLI
jgi:glycosyltransferase involved in cell wall biosynthesis